METHLVKPMFYWKQKIVCVNSYGRGHNGADNPLIEGKTYIVSNPDSRHPKAIDMITIKLYNMPTSYHFNQNRFIPLDTDRQLEDEIHEALKGNKLIEK